MTADSTNPFTTSTPPPSQPKIFRTDESNKYVIKNIFKSKLIFIILGVIILIEAAVVFRYTSQSSTAVPAVNQEINQVLPLTVGPLGRAKIALVTEKSQYQIGDTVPVLVRISTGGYYSDGVDLLLKYDPKVLEASSSAIISGDILPNYPIKSVDAQKGLISVSAISSVETVGFNGIGNSATINFKAKQVGETSLSVEFSEESTGETNVIKHQDVSDILDEVTGATISITTESVPNQEELTCTTKTYQSCVDIEGRTGSYWCTGLNDSLTCQVGCFREEKSSALGCKVVTTN